MPVESGPRTAQREEWSGIAVPALVAVAAIFTLGWYASDYFPLFDDFAILGEIGGIPLRRILAEPLGGFYRPLGLAAFKAEASLFGFSRPWGVAAVSVAVHAANALLLLLFLKKAGLPGPSRRAASALFLLSPWGSEAFFWASAQFDLLATLMVMVALFAVHSMARGETARGGLAVAVAATIGALLSKESAVTLVPVGFLAAASYVRERGVSRRRLTVPILVLLAVTGAFLLFRSRVLPGLGGPYGEFETLVAAGAGLRNLRSHFEAFLLLPFRSTGAVLVGLQAVWAGSLVFLLVRASWRDPRGTLLRSLAFLASLAPVAALPSGPASIGAGRLLYLPGVLLVLVLAGGAGETVAPGRPGRAAATVLLALGLASLLWQQSLWRSATSLARRVVAAVEPFAGSQRPVYLLNLPVGFEGGPHLLKSYAFRYAHAGRGFPPVRARGVVLERNPLAIRILRSAPDPFSEGKPAPGDRRLRLLLDDTWLR